jgi:hypothetical protein
MFDDDFPQPAEVERIGRFSVFDRGASESRAERLLSRGRFVVLEHDDAGPILRAGPFNSVAIATDACRALSFGDEVKEDR